MNWEKLFSYLISITIGWATSDPSNRWTLLSNLVQLISDLHDMAAQPLDQQEASVLWGLLHACGRPEKPAKEDYIAEITNRERATVGLAPLSPIAIHHSLNQLKAWNVITQNETGEQWQFIERITIV